MKAALWREIPSVDELLGRPAVAALCAEAGRAYVVDRVREVVGQVRAEMGAAAGEAEARAALESLEPRIVDAVRRALGPSLVAVINATGVLLHTNLGRAPMSAAAAKAVMEAATSYTNLEYDLEAGRRGKRDVHAAALLRQLLGVPAVVVNNNAAAVFLALHEMAGGPPQGGAGPGEVIVSRGELIEIGGSFRIPDIMARSGAVLREVGTTNRTRVADYERSLNERTRLLLRVHPSNFRILGFTERPSLEEMVALARSAGLPLMEDLGSGCLFDLRPYGIQDEPTVQESIRAGVDLVTFSGDKLLGGPQAGVIAGRADLVERVRRNPLFRALRVDKMTYAALAATLRAYLSDRPDELPVVRMIRMSAEEVAARARAFVAGLKALEGRGWKFELRAGESVIGGGSTPGQSLPTTLVAAVHARLSAAEIETRLRGATPPASSRLAPFAATALPVIARVEEDRVLLDLRTVFPEQEPALRGALESIASP